MREFEDSSLVQEAVHSRGYEGFSHVLAATRQSFY